MDGPGNSEAALACLARAIAHAEHMGDSIALAALLCRVGDVHAAAADFARAEAHYEEALLIYAGFDHPPPHPVARTLDALADLWSRMGNAGGVAELRDQALLYRWLCPADDVRPDAALAEGPAPHRSTGDGRPSKAPSLTSLPNLLYLVEEMARGDLLGSLEQVVLLALLRLGANAYGMTVRREIEERTGRGISIGAVYTTLERLESKGFVTSHFGEPTAERGGRAKRHFRIEPSGEEALRASQEVIRKMSSGLAGQWGAAMAAGR